MAEPWRRPGAVAGLAVAFELSLGAVAVILGWQLGCSPLARVSSDPARLAWSSLLGLVATLPPLLGLRLVLACPLEPFVRLGRQLFGLVARLFPGASLVELALVSMAAGTGEELLFRGLVQDGLSRSIAHPLGVWVGLGVASLLFGLAHPLSRLYVVLATLTGAYLGWLLIATDSLVTPVVTHAAYDLAALALVSRRLQEHAPPEPAETHAAAVSGGVAQPPAGVGG